ncbi:ATP-binding protein [Streptomyces cyaneofuscatus]|uniref:sensor histidine kinase n=1 Tax=Streptomyces cyaneofuscatus TaxID=66883 RepID=UPI003CF9B452
MSDRAVHSRAATGRGRRRHAPAEAELTRRSARSLALVPAGVVSATMGAAWAVQSGAHLPLPLAAGGALLICIPALLLADRRGRALTAAASRRRAEEREAADTGFAHLAAKSAELRNSIAWALEQVEQGVISADFPQLQEPAEAADAYGVAQQALDVARWETVQAIFRAAAQQHRLVDAEREHSEIFLAIAGRLQALVGRAIEAIIAVESDIEDPDQLNEIFRIDHLTTQIGRAVESLAVLGGRMPSRSAEPLLLSAAMRLAVAEVEKYARVRVMLPQHDRELPGYAGPGVVHLLAELIDNATKFSPPETEVLLRAMPVPAGLAIEVEDHGLPMSPAKLDAMNRLLAEPHTVDRRAHIKAGHIGLLVAARLAARHHIHLVLRPNIFGGTQAVVILPPALLKDPSPHDTRPPAAPLHAASRPPLPVHDPADLIAAPVAPGAVTARTPQGATAPDSREPSRGRPALPVRPVDADNQAPVPSAGDVPASTPRLPTPGLMARFAAGAKAPAAGQPVPPPSRQT